MIKEINSPSNPLIKHVVKLHNPKYRRERKQYIAEGFKTIATIIQSQGAVITLFSTPELLYDAQQLLSDENRIIIITPSVLKKISNSQTPSGLIAVFAMPQSPSLDQLGSGIVLANITDPGNMGTLIRTAAAMNKKTVICIGGVDPFNPKVVQSSAGAIAAVSLFDLEWNTLIEHKKDLTLCALVASQGENPHNTNLRNTLLVVGNESLGIPDEWLKQCDSTITLPMPGNFESLNAAVAGSIALYLAAIQNTVF